MAEHFADDPAEGEVVAAQQSARAEDHHQDQDHRVQDHAVIRHAAQGLGQDGQDGGRQDGAQHRAHAAQHHHDQDLDRLHEVEAGRVQNAQIAGVQAARQPGEGRREGEGHDLVIGGLDAAALGCDLVVPDGQDGAAVPALDHGVDEKAGQHHAQEHRQQVGVLGDVLQALGAVEKGKAQDVVDVVQGDADDLAKAQRQDGQIVAAQAQGWDADQHAEQAGHQRAQGQARRKGNRLRPGAVFGEQGAGVGAHRHKAGVAQRQLAQVAGGHVQGDGQDDIDAHQQQDFILVGAQDAGRQGLQREKEQDHQHGIDEIAHRHFQRAVFRFCFAHSQIPP